MPFRPIVPADVSVLPVLADRYTSLIAMLNPGLPSHSRSTLLAEIATAWTSSMVWLVWHAAAGTALVRARGRDRVGGSDRGGERKHLLAVGARDRGGNRLRLADFAVLCAPRTP
jgi:hypothetical protein